MQSSVLGCGVGRFPWKKGGHSRLLQLQAHSGAPIFGSLCELPLGKSTFCRISTQSPNSQGREERQGEGLNDLGHIFPHIPVTVIGHPSHCLLRHPSESSLSCIIPKILSSLNNFIQTFPLSLAFAPADTPRQQGFNTFFTQ